MPQVTSYEQQNLIQAYFKFEKVIGSGSLGRVFSISTFDGLSIPLVIKTFNDNDELSVNTEAISVLTVGNGMADKCLNFIQSYGQFICGQYPPNTNVKGYICSPLEKGWHGDNDLHVVATKIKGTDLKDFLRRIDLYNEEDVVSIILQVYISLKIARYHYGFVHGDLHTNNVMITSLDEYRYLKYKVSDLGNPGNTKVIYVKARFLAVLIDYGLSRFKYKSPVTQVEHYFDAKSDIDYLIVTKADDEIEDIWKFLNWVSKETPMSNITMLFFNLFFPEAYRTESARKDMVGEHAPPPQLSSYTGTSIKILSNPPLLFKIMDIIFSLKEKQLLLLEAREDDSGIEYKTGYKILAPLNNDIDSFLQDIFSNDVTESEEKLSSLSLHDLVKRFVYQRDERFFKHLLKRREEFEAELEVYLSSYPSPGIYTYAQNFDKWQVLYYRYLSLKQVHEFFKWKSVPSIAMSRFEERIRLNEMLIPKEKRRFFKP